MNVQRSTADQVRAKLELLKKKQEEGTKEYGMFFLVAVSLSRWLTCRSDFEARIAELRAKEEAEKQKQREKKKRKRNKTSGPSQDADSGEEQEGVRESAVASTEADEMARIMGFGGFTAKT